MMFDYQGVKSGWLDRGVVLASGSSVRRDTLARIFASDNIAHCPSPDDVEREKWGLVSAQGLCQVAFAGSVHSVAAEKLRWLLSQGVIRDKLAIAMDTVPCVLRMPPVKYVENAEWRRFYPYSFDVFHKPRSKEKAIAQLSDLFARIVVGYQQREHLHAVLGVSGSLADPLVLKKREWQGRLSPADEFLFHQNYIACIARVVTGVAVYIPELHRIITSSPYCDFTFDTLMKWVEERGDISPRDENIQKLAVAVYEAQKSFGGNPDMIPGGLDYAACASNQEVCALLGLRGVSSDMVTPEEVREICLGAPSSAISRLMDRAAYMVLHSPCAPFPEGYHLGDCEDRLQVIRRARESLDVAIVNIALQQMLRGEY